MLLKFYKNKKQRNRLIVFSDDLKGKNYLARQTRFLKIKRNVAYRLVQG